MRRAERLFQLVQLLRSRRSVTAQFLAESLEVSERTVYRDVRDLSLSGVPIRGEAGVGYALGQGFDLPPLMFTEEELEALVLGVRVVQGYADPSLAKAADSVLAKVQLVLPQPLRDGVGRSKLLVPTMRPGRTAPHLGALRLAIREKRTVRIDYADEKQRHTQRTVRPLAVAFWGKIWSLAAWCELRQGFRSFRLDRIATAELTGTFADEPGKTLDDFIDAVTRQVAAQQGETRAETHRRAPRRKA